MTSALDINSFLAKNLEVLSKRFPVLAERLVSMPLPQIQKTGSKDGGYCYAQKDQNKQWRAITNPVDPISKAQKAVNAFEDRINSGIAPAVVIGLDPGYTLEIIYNHFKENYYGKYIPRRIYVLLDSTACLYAWLNSADRTKILLQEEVEFYWHSEARRIVRQCKRDEERSHLFIPISTLPEATSLAIMEPLAQFFLARQEDEKKLLEENRRYYKDQSDQELNKIIEGKAGRKPRMLIPSHASSTVVQYSVRDTAAMFEKEGWEVRVMNMKTDLSCWRINKNIHEFKPDVYLLVNHLRTGDTQFYPEDMMFVSWIQDTVSYINNSESAEAWNEHVKSKEKRRDLIIGYVRQIKQYGYLEDRLTECPMIVNQDLFKERKISAQDQAKYECDICFASNRSKETSLIVKEDLAPKLEKFGFSESILMSIHDHLWEHYRDEKTCVGYIQLEDKIIELSEVCSLIEKLINKDDHDFVIQRIYWALNDVIYRHIVLEWIDEMEDKKLHLYGRGWEDHPKFSKYAKGILNHGEELSLAYQCAKHCLHLNSLEGEHQRLSEIIDAKGNPLTRTSLEKAVSKKYQNIVKSYKDFNDLSEDFVYYLYGISFKLLKQSKSENFNREIRNEICRYYEKVTGKLRLLKISINDKNDFKNRISQIAPLELQEFRGSNIYQEIIRSFYSEPKYDNHLSDSFANFLEKIHLDSENAHLRGYQKLENNLLCLSLINSKVNDEQESFKKLRERIDFNLLLPRFSTPFIHLCLSMKIHNEILPLIDSIYKTNDKINNLYFKIAVAQISENPEWFEIARKDIKAKRLNFPAATKLLLSSCNTDEELKVLKELLENFEDIQALENGNFIQFLTFFAQIYKRYGIKKLDLVFLKLSKIIPEALLKSVYDATLLETGESKLTIKVTHSTLENFYVKILSNNCESLKQYFRPEYFKGLLNVALNALDRGMFESSIKVFNFLSSIDLTQTKAKLLLSSSNKFNDETVLSFIDKMYFHNKALVDLHLFFAQQYKQKQDWVEYGLKDFKNERLSIQKASLLATISVKRGDESDTIKQIAESFSKLKEPEKVNVFILVPILSQIIKILGPDKVNIFSEEQKSLIPSLMIKLSREIAMAENNIEIQRGIDHDNIPLNSYMTEYNYYRILKNRKKVNNIKVDKLIKLARSAFARKREAPYFKVLDYLFKSNSLPSNHLMAYIELLRSVSLEKTLKLFSSIKQEDWDNNTELQYQYTKLLSGKKFSSELIQDGNILSAILLSEDCKNNLAINTIPENSSNEIINLWKTVIYQRANKACEAEIIFESNFNLNYSNLTDVKITELVNKVFNKLRSDNKTIEREFLIFRLINPMSEINDFSHPAQADELV